MVVTPGPSCCILRDGVGCLAILILEKTGLPARLLATVIGEREAPANRLDRGFIFLLPLLLFSVLSGVAIIGRSRQARFVCIECLLHYTIREPCHWNALGLGFVIKPGDDLTRQLRRIPFGSCHLVFPQFLRIALTIGSTALYIFIAVEAASSIASIVRIILQLCCCFFFFAFAIYVAPLTPRECVDLSTALRSRSHESVNGSLFAAHKRQKPPAEAEA
jgi:hypothetical protein